MTILPDVTTLFQTALAAQRAGDLDAALAGYRKLLRRQPQHADALCNTGIILAIRGDRDGALAKLTAATVAAPRHGSAWTNKAILEVELDRLEAALASYDAALAATPRNLTARINRGLLLAQMGRHRDAVTAFEGALAINPRLADVEVQYGIALRRSFRLAEADAAFARALAINPDLVDALAERGYVLGELKQIAASTACYDRALALDPTRHHLRDQRLFQRRELCDWTDDAAELAIIAANAEAGILPTGFSVLSMFDDPDLQRRSAAAFLQARHAAVARPAPPLPPPGERLRIGYFSADFHEHPVMNLIGETLAAHDRQRVHLSLFSYGPPSTSPQRRTAMAAADQFHDVAVLTDTAIADVARRHQIDVAIDLTLLTGEGRPGIFAARAAAVQAGYLGYAGSMGVDWYDYLIADRVVVPPEERRHYSEALALLPGCFQANARLAPLPATRRADHGLPEDAVVLASFNQLWKLTPTVFEAWAAILAACPATLLWLPAGPVPAANLRRELAARDIDPARLVTAGRVADLDAHLARLGLADLFLDSMPYNAHTSASDALRVGVPVITAAGRSYAARVPMSILATLGLGELVADDLAGYRDLAIALARDTERRRRLREQLVAAVAGSPLFDPAQMARSLEDAAAAMVARARRGEAPADFQLG